MSSACPRPAKLLASLLRCPVKAKRTGNAPPPHSTFGFQVRSDRDKFVIFLDVKHFSPEDLTVKVQDDFVEIHGKHNERQDDHGYISREFHRRYRLPSNVDQSALSCSLSADGMLTFSGPKIQTGLDATHERAIPVAREEKPSSAPSS
uniref:Alpha-crystallin A chain n=1 Tax=Rhinopithecus roxellana TaxID=61622 RepID=A0A2K6PKR7_RHIRO